MVQMGGRPASGAAVASTHLVVGAGLWVCYSAAGCTRLMSALFLGVWTRSFAVRFVVPRQYDSDALKSMVNKSGGMPPRKKKSQSPANDGAIRLAPPP